MAADQPAPPFGDANEAILALEEPGHRRAFMALRSEIYGTLSRQSQFITDTQALIRETGSQLQAFIQVAAEERRADRQAVESSMRVFERLAEQFSKHMDSDEWFQEKTDKQFDSWKNWLIGTLLTLCGSMIVALVVVVFQNGLPGHH